MGEGRELWRKPTALENAVAELWHVVEDAAEAGLAAPLRSRWRDRIDALIEAAREEERPTCKWTDHVRTRKAGCNGAVLLAPVGYVYCPYCGGKIEEASDRHEMFTSHCERCRWPDDGWIDCSRFGGRGMAGTEVGCTQEELRAAVAKAESSPAFKEIEAKAKLRGFRHASWEERWMLSRDELFSWRGTVWVWDKEASDEG